MTLQTEITSLPSNKRTNGLISWTVCRKSITCAHDETAHEIFKSPRGLSIEIASLSILL